MGKTEQGPGQHHKGKRKNKARMNYLKQVRQNRGGRGRGGHNRGQGTTVDADGYLVGGYVSSYGHGQNNKRRARQQLIPGMRGFLLTTNFRESDCVKEGYNLLNEYYQDEDEELQESAGPSSAGALMKDNAGSSEAEAAKKEGDELEAGNITAEPQTDPKPEDKTDTGGPMVVDVKGSDPDIDDELQKEMKELRSDNTKRRFQSVDTGVKNLIFISSTVTHPADIVYRIFEDVVTKKESKSRNILRFLPIQGSCNANDASIRQLSQDIFKPYFKDGYKSFKVVANIRYSSFSSKEAIRTLAEVVNEINPLNVVNLADPEYTIIAEVLKATFCISVVKHFARFKKFNITEIITPTPAPEAKPQSKTVAVADAGAKSEIPEVKAEATLSWNKG